MGGRLEKVIAVAKMRGLEHSKELRRYDIGPTGIVVAEPLTAQAGILVGVPRPIG